MWSLNDDKHLVLPELEVAIVGAADMADEADALGVLFDDDGVVRGHEAFRSVRDDGCPWVLADEALDRFWVGHDVVGSSAHGLQALQSL